MPILSLDYETRSVCPLQIEGVYRYARHPSTDITCAAWAIDDGPIELWLPGDPVPEELIEHVAAGGLVRAWNAAFERLIWWHVAGPRHGWPAIALEQFACTAAQARSQGWPGGLDKAARFANTDYRKDADGHRVMLKLCKPRRTEPDGTPVWWDDPDDYAALYAYCVQDVEVERAIAETLLPWQERERWLYLATERLNDRGVRFDRDLAVRALTAAELERSESNARLSELTGGAVSGVTKIADLKGWLADAGLEIDSLGKPAVAEILENQDVADDVREVLDIRTSNGAAAVSKFQAMLDRGVGDHLHGLFMFCGAGQTGRWSGAGRVQIHNLRRDAATVREVETFKHRGVAALRLLGSPVQLLAGMVRLALVPEPGALFAAADYSAVEARVLPWLALGCGVKDKSLEAYLEAWRRGDPIYEIQAAAMGVGDRQIGKVAVLSLGFGGGAGAYRSMARNYGIRVDEKTAEKYKVAWRRANPWAQKFWYKLEQSVLLAMRSPGQMIDLGLLAFMFEAGHLWCRMPSGRLFCYPFASVVDGQYGDVVQYRRGNRAPKAGSVGWPTVDLWGGLVSENLTQGAARDVMADAILAIEAEPEAGTVRLHIHDEIVLEHRVFDEARLALIERLMTCSSPWAAGLPLKVDIKTMTRYMK